MSKSILKRLNAIDAAIKEARARGDWKAVAELHKDWSFVFRQSMR
jgi:hypothetical protein